MKYGYLGLSLSAPLSPSLANHSGQDKKLDRPTQNKRKDKRASLLQLPTLAL